MQTYALLSQTLTMSAGMFGLLQAFINLWTHCSSIHVLLVKFLKVNVILLFDNLNDAHLFRHHEFNNWLLFEQSDVQKWMNERVLLCPKL